MAVYNTEIANLAIAHLGVSKQISDLETETTVEARTCRLFFERALKSVLRSYPWPFCTEVRELSLVEEDPNDEWAFSYRYPAEALHVRRILNPGTIETSDTRLTYKIAQDDTGKLIFTDQEDAQVEITKYIEDYTVMTDDFQMALSFLLAHYIAPTLTNGDPFKLGERAKLNYLEEISKAKGTSVNEEEVGALPESEYVRGRV